MERVKSGLSRFPEITVHGQSDSSSEIVITIEALSAGDLDRICEELKREISGIVDIAHLYVNFEEELEKILDSSTKGRPGPDSPTYWE
jgi:nitrate reductase NapAB chaperone NapD